MNKILWALFALVLVSAAWIWAAVTVTESYSQRYEAVQPTAFVDPVPDPTGLKPVTPRDTLLKVDDENDDIGREPTSNTLRRQQGGR